MSGRNQRARNFIVISLLAHIILVIVLTFMPSFRLYRFEDMRTVELRPVEDVRISGADRAATKKPSGRKSQLAPVKSSESPPAAENPPTVELDRLAPGAPPSDQPNTISDSPQVTGGSASSGSEPAIDAAGWARGINHEQMAALTPFLSAVARRLDQSILIEKELRDERSGGTVGLELELDANGRIRRMTTTSSSRSHPLAGLTAQHFERALGEKISPPAPLATVKILVLVKYSFSHPRDTAPSTEPIVTSNTIRLAHNIPVPAKYDLTVMTWDDNIIRRLFGKRPTSQRMLWDFNHRMKEFEWSCEVQNSEGACFQAAKGATLLGRKADAKKWFDKSCQLGVQQACELLAEFRD